MLTCMYALAVLSALPVATVTADPRLWVGTTGDVIRDEFLITLKERASESAAKDVINLLKRFGGSLIREHKVVNRRFAHVHITPGNARHLLANPHIDMIESNTLIHLEEPVEEGAPVEIVTPHRRERRSHGNKRCHYDYPGIQGWGNIRTSHRDHPGNWDEAPYIWGDGDSGEGVDIYIIDSGIRLNHTDFEGRAIWGKTGYGRPAGEPDDDLRGHGTHVAGTTGGKRFGIAKKSTLIACKVLDQNGSGSISDTLVMMEYIVERMAKQRAEGKVVRAVMNQSYGGTASNGSYAREASMSQAVDYGIIGASSSGNDARDACRNSPTRVSSVFSTVASDRDDTVASFSNWGPCADIIAPGRFIWAADHHNATAYSSKSGTSMAAPHVAGMAARFLSSLSDEQMKTMSAHKARAMISKQTTRNRIIFQGEQRPGPNHLLYRECGNVDAAETTQPHTTGTTVTTTSQLSTTTQATTTRAPELTEKLTQDDVGELAVGTLGLSAGIIGVSFGITALLHVRHNQM